jgi:hypothetical protein
MLRFSLRVVTFCFFVTIFAGTDLSCVHSSPAEEDAASAAEVKSEFARAWNGYKQYAWGHDELLPISNGYQDWYSSTLLFTPVDALDTMILMGLTDQANEDRLLIDQKLSFDHDMLVRTFEINIRDLGGLLSGYQLTGDQRLLELAQDLGNRLLPAFHSPTGMPYNFVNLRTGAVQGNVVDVASVTTYMIEFGTLSKITGNPTYYDTAKKAIVGVYNRRSALGLVGFSLNVETGEWASNTSTIGPGCDSYYEYLLKAWLLFGDPDFKSMWDNSVVAVNTYLARQSAIGFYFAQADMNSGTQLSGTFNYSDSFFAAVLARSGDVTNGRALEETGFRVWNFQQVEPTTFDTAANAIQDPAYGLYPEIVEGDYYLYSYTGDPHFQSIGRTILGSLILYCRTSSGFAELSDVTTKQQRDRMQSYTFAETLKYLYLLYAPRSTLDLNQVVFNTEGHPIRRTW